MVSDGIIDVIQGLLRGFDARAGYMIASSGDNYSIDDFKLLNARLTDKGCESIVASEKAMFWFMEDTIKGVAPFDQIAFGSFDTSSFVTIGGAKEDVSGALLEGWL